MAEVAMEHKLIHLPPLESLQETIARRDAEAAKAKDGFHEKTPMVRRARGGGAFSICWLLGLLGAGKKLFAVQRGVDERAQ